LEYNKQQIEEIASKYTKNHLILHIIWEDYRLDYKFRNKVNKNPEFEIEDKIIYLRYFLSIEEEC
jgi:hypothetical protein